jgi:hypothetical protein
MAKAVFTKPFDFTDHTRGMSVHFDASDKEVTTTEEIVTAAVDAGVAMRVSPPAKTVSGKVAETAEYTGKKDDTDAVTAKSAAAAAKTSAATPTTTANPTAKSGSTSTADSATISTTATNATTSKG